MYKSPKNTEKYGKIQKKYGKIRENTEKYGKIRKNTGKYEKIQIFNGVKSFILDMLYEILSVKGLKLNNKLPDFIFMLIESPKVVIEDNIRKIFYLDNQFVTEGEKSIKFSNGDTK